MITVSSINIYPLKSTKGTSLQKSAISNRGLQYDRRWVIIDSQNQAITARDFPQLLDISSLINGASLRLFYKDKLIGELSIKEKVGDLINLSIFSEGTSGLVKNQSLNTWFSEFLHVSCKVVYMREGDIRPVAAKRGGKPGDEVSYADECPILLIGDASLNDLNSRLGEKLSMDRFRPNIVVSGCAPYEEEKWATITIGDTEYEINQTCKRCVFITIDPMSKEKHERQEPLRTLATYKQRPGGGVIFGVHLIPRKLGTINLNDQVFVR